MEAYFLFWGLKWCIEFVKMVWRFPWSDSIKKRACRYLLQRYLGQFLKEKLTLEQLSIDIYEGTGEIQDILLDVDVSLIAEIKVYACVKLCPNQFFTQIHISIKECLL